MRHSPSSRAVLVGIAYVIIGLGAAALAGRASSAAVRSAWRLSAFATSLGLFVAHVRSLRGLLPVRAAFVAAAAVGVAALILAAKANVTTYRAGLPLHLSSLVVWPAFTMLPAFALAWAMGSFGSRGR